MVFFFVFGIIIGSFLNVVICRLQKEETLLGRSHCTRCERQIAWYDNIPLLSFMLLRGSCRHCHEKISWQYPLVELGTGLLFVLVGRFVFSLTDMTSFVATVFYTGLFALLVVIFVYDILTMYIPMIMIWTALAWTSSYLVFSQFFLPWFINGSQRMDLVMFISGMMPYVFAGGGAYLFFWLLVRVSHETWMGMGDAYLALLVGLVTGWPGVLWAMTLAFGIGAVAGVLLIAFGKKGMKSQVPFAPFLALGIVLVVLLPEMFPSLNFLMIF